MHILSQILFGQWAISYEYALASYPMINSLLEGKAVQWEDTPPTPKGALAIPQGRLRTEAFESFSEAPQGSIAKLSLKGPMMRDDQFCGPRGTTWLAEQIRLADEAEGIDAIILEIDSPGGQVAGTEELGNAVAKSATPIYSLCHLAASAGYWPASHSKEVWMSAKTSQVGSIGVVCSFADMRPAWEARGIKFHEVYSKDSPDKNRSFREALEGKYSRLQEELTAFDRIFMDAVKAHRPGIAAEALTGKTYLAEEAIQLGLADRIGSMGELVAYIRNSSQTPNHESMSEKGSGSYLGKFKAIFGSDESVKALNEEIGQLQSAKTKAELERDQARKKASELEASKQELTEKVAALTEERDQWKAKAEQYGSQPGAMPSEPPATSQPDGDRRDAVDQFFDPNAAHNQI